jgi:hypothetical protein
MEIDVAGEMLRLQTAIRPRGGFEHLLAAVVRVLVMAALAIAAYLEIRLSAR